MDEAANEAVDWAVKEDLLDGLISAEKDEVIGMILSEYNEEAFIKTLREDGYDEGHSDGFVEGRAEGLAEGERKKAVETARNLLTKGINPDIIAECTGLSSQKVKDLACN